jgi:hypothetical protein
MGAGASAAVAAPGGSSAPTVVAPMVAHESTAVLTGLLPDGTTWTGTVTDLVVENVGGELMLSGLLSGTVEGVGSFAEEFTTELLSGSTPDSQPGGCSILNLDLGPLELDVLGLVIELSDVQLDITAVPGAGNLLGNLLCAVAGLLDGPGNPLNAITNLLNRLLGGLGLAA